MAKRVALVTGANRGIGYEIVRQLAGAGVDAVGTSRDLAAGQAVGRKLGVRFVTLDVTQPASVDALPEQLGLNFDHSGASTERRRGIDILINNAGISMQGFDSSVARHTLDVNFFGALRVTDRLLPAMRAGGRIVLVSSGLGAAGALAPALRSRFLDPMLTRDELIELMESFVRDVAAGVHTQKGWPSSAYRVSKVGLNALARVMARDLREDPRRILVNAGSPGWVRTAMGGSGAPLSPAEGARTPVWLAMLPDGGPSGGYFEDEREVPW
jgi:NAD(P)-dependent dehydrogenase (short-subunit alcohol dehydrogenase family)